MNFLANLANLAAQVLATAVLMLAAALLNRLRRDRDARRIHLVTRVKPPTATDGSCARARATVLS